MSNSDFLRGELNAARKEIEELEDVINDLDEIHFDEIQAADRYNNIMTIFVIVLAIWIADLTARHWNCF